MSHLALGDGEEYPLAGEIIDVEPITPPWPGWERLGVALGARAWQLELGIRRVLAVARIVAPIVLVASAHLAWRLPVNACLWLAAELNRRRLA